MTAEETWLERYVDERIREHKERIRLRELKRAAREAGHRCVAAERLRESEERARLRELRRQRCGAKTRAGHPCQRKLIGRRVPSIAPAFQEPIQKGAALLNHLSPRMRLSARAFQFSKRD